MWFKSCTKNEKIISDLGLLTALWLALQQMWKLNCL